MSNSRGRVMRFRISLTGIEPEIWRVIDVPESYSFWDLHVAIQDAMGWLDYHLHAFIPQSPGARIDRPIGIPDEMMDDGTIAGWEVPLTQCFVNPGDVLGYDYDFGDGWHHKITLTGVFLKEPKQKYPHCVGGERACPPEDCGGVRGYYGLLNVLADPSSEEHDEMLEWLKGHAKNYHPYDPDAFDPESVLFTNPKKRFKMAFEGR